MKEENDYFNEIYKTSRSRDNLILRSQAQREVVYQGKAYTELKAFSILAVPKINCDRIYLTSVLPISHPVPSQGIFEWKIGGGEVRELAITKEFSGNRAGPVSPDGEKIIVVQREEAPKGYDYCDFRILKLLDLRKDKSEVLIQLPKVETFDDSTSDLSPYCNGLNFGWENESTIYYDVYDATVDGIRPFLERRTLVIE